MTARSALIAGGGIGGLAAALACVRAGFQVRLFEQAAVFSEVGAGIQLGPNSTRVLERWGLQQALAEVAAIPERLVVRNAYSGNELGSLALAQPMRERYGAPYLTIHRADLQALLLAAVQASGAARLDLAARVKSFREAAQTVTVRYAGDAQATADLMVGADGLWSRVRAQMLGDDAPLATGHLAYRALLPQSHLPPSQRTHDVNVWLGRRLHVVAYPVRRGEWLNLVGIVHATDKTAKLRPNNWDHSADPGDLRAALAGCCADLKDLVQSVPDWRLWVLCDRPPMRSPNEHARGRVLLVGDAAHPMRPYLAQGAGMAIEDAAELERVLAADPLDVPAAVQRFAADRWQRNARVQARAQRNGRIFHASGPLAWGRDAAIGLLGKRLLDLPWLYKV